MVERAGDGAGPRGVARRGGSTRAELGRRAEDLACAHLTARGFEIIARNARVGRLELDVIARRGALIVFCEVRSRSSDRLMTPAQSIDPRKVARVRAAAAQWLRTARPGASQLRFDVASVLFDEPAGRLNYLEGAF
jgi:putative endonuclease